MKKLKALLALALCLVLALPCALAEGTYQPGKAWRALFADVFTGGRMITADLSLQFEVNAEALGLSEDELALFNNALLPLLDSATLRVGACRIDGGVRVMLAGMVKAQEGAQDVYADAAVDITGAGLSVDSSLLTGRRVSVTWETLLSLCGLSDEEIAMVMGLKDADFDALLTELLSMAETYLSTAAQILAPYGETAATWAAGLTVETLTDVEATEDYPAAAVLYNVYVTQKDLGELVTQLATQLEGDTTLCALLDMALSELDDESIPSAAALCAAMREQAASWTDTDYPLILTLAMDAEGTPLYAELFNAEPDGTAQYAGAFCYPAGDGAYAFELSAFTLTAQNTAKDGFSITGNFKGDEADPLACDLTMDFVMMKDGAYFYVYSIEEHAASQTTAEGLPGYRSTQAFSVSMDMEGESVSMIANAQSVFGLTAQGGETSDVTLGIDAYIGEEKATINALATLIVEPCETGLTGSFSVLESAPDVGFDRMGIQAIFASSDYVPAQLTELALETATDEQMNAVSDDVSAAAMQLLDQLTQAIPAESLELLSALAE